MPEPMTRKSSSSMLATVKSPISWFTPRELSERGILRTIAAFVRCAKLAHAAGYDGVEIMGSEGYLLALEEEADFIKREEQRLAKRRKGFESRFNALHRHVENLMKHFDMPLIEGRFNKLVLQQNPPSLKIDDADKLPAEYKHEETIVTTVVHNAEIKAALVAHDKAVVEWEKNFAKAQKIAAKTGADFTMPPKPEFAIAGARLERAVTLRIK